MAQEITVSIIIPVYNESKYIIRCLDSVKRQTFPAENTELLIIDGNSTDDTVSKIRNYTGIDNLRILINEKRLVTYALNIGIDNARGEYVIRMDAHAEYADDYVEKCVYYLEHTDADNVGGTAETRGISFAGQANAELLSSKFGVGNSDFRTGGKSGYVDTVPFGAFRRTVFSKIGYFDRSCRAARTTTTTAVYEPQAARCILHPTYILPITAAIPQAVCLIRE